MMVSTAMPPLETGRLLIRPFTLDDLSAVHQLLDVDLGAANLAGSAGWEMSLTRRKRWLEWTVLNYEQLASLFQPPYGDRAVVQKSTGRLVGACGYVPCLAPFQQLPGFFPGVEQALHPPYQPEVGLFYAIAPASQRQGLASEAANRLLDYAFQDLHLDRVVATTSFDNLASVGVMKKLGMRILENAGMEPSWMQIVGVLP